MQDVYETHYGIYNHLVANTRPLASVAMHACEDVNEQSQFQSIVHSYHIRGIKDLFGLNLIEFLELPMDIVDMLFTLASEINAKKAATLNDVENQFK